MKKVIFIFMAALAFSCGGGGNQANESGTDTETEDTYDAAESDTTGMSDTTASPAMDRQNGSTDTTRNKQQ